MKVYGKKIMIFIILLFAISITISMTSGKYIYNSVWNYYLKSKGFYFESDLLDTSVKKNSLLKWDGSDIYFIIKNSLNPELISEYDISYKTTCTVLGEEATYIECVLNGTNSSEFNGSLPIEEYCMNNKDSVNVSQFSKTDCELNGYVWTHEITSKTHYFNLILKDATKDIDEVSVMITAESLNPYHKTLKGVFNLNKVEEIESEFELEYQSFNEFDELTIINKTNQEKCFLIEFDPNNYLFDLSNYEISNYSTDENGGINNINIKVTKQSSSAYDFYKINNEKIYSINDLIVTEKEC